MPRASGLDAGQPDGGMSPGQSIRVGNLPVDLIVADLNGDNLTDIAVANQDSDNVSIILGQAGGQFGGATNFAVGAGPGVIRSGDFNRDGRIDLVTANQGDFPTEGGLSLLLGMGDGIFQPAQDISPGNASAVAVGDFNQDGVDDIARSHSNLNQLSVLQGNGDGTFQAARPLALAGPATVLAVADFDGDNRLDLVAGRFGGLSILTGDGSGRFQTSQEFSFASGGATWQVEVEDLALDGDLDVVSTNIDNSVSVFLNNGGGFNPPLFFCPTG